MNDFLSVIVPIRNAEGTLTKQVGQLLDVLPDAHSPFEIILVDDGSTDHTVDVARELACEYPQLRFIRHAEQRGVSAAIKTGSQWAQGRTLVVHESASIAKPADLRRAWRMTNRQVTDVTNSVSPAEQPNAHGRTDIAHKSLRSSRHVNAFLSHLRTLALGE